MIPAGHPEVAAGPSQRAGQLAFTWCRVPCASFWLQMRHAEVHLAVLPASSLAVSVQRLSWNRPLKDFRHEFHERLLGQQNPC